MSKNIFVVGSLNMDMAICAPYCPQGGETLAGNGFMTNCGGKGANQAAADIYLTQSENPAEIIGYGLRQAKEKGMFTILNPAPANPAIKQFFRFADIIVPNESEAALLGGKKELLKAGASVVITTLGGNGYEIATKKAAQIYPCIRVKAVDTTAAGDTLCGGLAAGLARGESLEQTMAFASKAASIACTKQGAAQSIPTYAEVQAFESIE